MALSPVVFHVGHHNMETDVYPVLSEGRSVSDLLQETPLWCILLF